ncbi:MAG: AGE family epimerase/isomerase [Sedimentisphaerales bacterium]|nr:AGE family epimerase/isomerase [Sedimentisphaerales bacterium]
MDKKQVASCLAEAQHHLNQELLPFWLNRCMDKKNGGFITQFDKDGNDTGEDVKSLIAQARCTYTFASAHRAGFGEGKCAEFARHGVNYLLDVMWDKQHEGFYWTTNRAGEVLIDKKILYGQSFAIYALSEYTLATGDPRGLETAQRLFELIQIHCTDTMYGGYFEMFERNWELCLPGPSGGDRKTLDVHMHLMEAFTALYEASGRQVHRRKLLEDIALLNERILHPQYRTGIPQFRADWSVAPQIKFDIVWGWDRFTDGQQKANPTDNTAYGHNVEFVWLLLHAMDILEMPVGNYEDTIRKALMHTIENGIDRKFGGVFVEGPHTGGVYDREKEFWQQAEVLIGMLEAVLRFGPDPFWQTYYNVHRFVFDKVIHHEIGEWWPLLTREGQPIWTHMSHSWKINYHTIRAMIQCIQRLEKIQGSI